MHRRTLLGATAAAAAGAHAQTAAFPDRAIRIVVPWPPGGGTDILARAVAARMATTLGQPVVVDNRAGANGAIGSQEAARARPDGHTLLLVTADTHGIAPALRADLPYDAERDFAPVIWLTTQPLALCLNPGVPATDVAGFLALARARPGALAYASWGIGSTAHMAMERLMLVSGTQLTHVPYRGAAPAVTDLMAGQVQAMFTGPATILQHAGPAGRLRCLATASPRRPSPLPDLPTFAEAGMAGLDMELWFGLAAPAGTPPAVIDALHRAAAEALGAQPVLERIAAIGQQVVGGPPGLLGEHITREVEQWRQVVRTAGIRPD